MAGRKAGGWAVAILAAATVLAFHQQAWFAAPRLNFATVFYLTVAGMLIWMLAASARRRRFTHLPVAAGRVVVIVPAYNEDPALLEACVRSLLLQTVPVHEIIVVDDGSDTPVEPTIHDPRVTWLRQHNAGKRHAQIAGLTGRKHADYIVTVDSDSVVAPDGIEQLLRAMSDPRIHAATGACIVRNRTDNLLTRLVDLELNLGNLIARRARSLVGAVAPTSGPLAIYRAAVIFDHAAEYVTDGTYGDDRRLTHYALQRGQVVAVDEAVVEFQMPTTTRGTFKQRVRWFKGYFRYLPWELRHLTGWALALRCWNLTLLTLYPPVLAVVLIAVPVAGGRIYWEAFAYWAILVYVQAAHYALDRPGLPLRTRIAAWLLLTPLLVPYQALLIRPAMYWAITQLRDTSWATRGTTHQPTHRRTGRGRYRVRTAQEVRA
ncbi:glycosyltransferase family 2 protein [Jiangella alkaliphila]|uniref:Hyaluronan synthase n=1 Tax=Jiangella alkaliphila TaxID=419479 RepID=A0A1H2IG23_9ACTN|nr:glycosyltransferase [Jiangella alkaliphila]SDU42951.1 hyaluronan synthase [Jiangella alkaliphila]